MWLPDHPAKGVSKSLDSGTRPTDPRLASVARVPKHSAQFARPQRAARSPQEARPKAMARIRQKNVTAAQWSPNGGALGALDLTQPSNNPFGANVFSLAVQRQRLPKDVFRKLQRTLDKGEALDPSLADAVANAMKEWALENGRHPLHAHVPAAHRPDGREARLVLRPRRRGHRARGVLGQGADPGRAGRLLVPHRRRPRDLRGARLHRLGPHQPGVHPGEPQRGAALHPHRVRVVDRRGAGRQDPAAALDGRPFALRRPGAEAARRRGVRAGVHHRRARAGVLPDRRAVLLRASRPGQHGPHAVRRQAAEGPRAGRPLLRLDPRARAGVHDGDRARAGQARRARQDAPQRGGAGAVRDRAGVRELERGLRPPAADDAADAEHRPQVRAGLPAAREAVRGRERLGQAQQLVDGHRRRRTTCSSPATPRRRT